MTRDSASFVTQKIANQAVIRDGDRVAGRDLLRLVVILLFLLIPFLIYIAEGIEVVRTSYQVEVLKAKRKALEDENRALEVERAELLAPYRLEGVALSKLGFQYPVPGDIVYVSCGALPGDENADGAGVAAIGAVAAVAAIPPAPEAAADPPAPEAATKEGP